MAKKQLRIAGTEKKTNREVEVAAEAYAKARDERIECSESESVAKETLIAMMEKAELTIYKDEDASPPLIITLVDGKKNVKVTTADTEDDEPSFPRGRSAAAASAPADED